MVRAPCCDEKMGLKKGPWSPEEDQILVKHIRLYGHPNWRALPKRAGLLRCGKSCRLRWINYLRPDIKRGNFSKEEEEMIIQLHDKLGNRWSAIAARLPGRTDNEIKNVWHTHLKKRVKPPRASEELSIHEGNTAELERRENDVVSMQGSCSELSSIKMESAVEIDEDFLSDILSAENYGGVTDFAACFSFEADVLSETLPGLQDWADWRSDIVGDDVDFWYRLLREADQSRQLPDSDASYLAAAAALSDCSSADK